MPPPASASHPQPSFARAMSATRRSHRKSHRWVVPLPRCTRASHTPSRASPGPWEAGTTQLGPRHYLQTSSRPPLSLRVTSRPSRRLQRPPTSGSAHTASPDRHEANLALSTPFCSLRWSPHLRPSLQKVTDVASMHQPPSDAADTAGHSVCTGSCLREPQHRHAPAVAAAAASSSTGTVPVLRGEDDCAFIFWF